MNAFLGPIAADHHIIDHRARLELAAADRRRIVAASTDARPRRPRDLLAAARRRFRPTDHGRGPDAVVVVLPAPASGAPSPRSADRDAAPWPAERVA